MRLPVIQGVIQRRLLLNYRVRPDLLRPLLPAPFEPKTVDGWGMAGVCLIHLVDLRPRGVPGRLGLSSENGAHRVAVEWDGPTGRQEGVFVLRRDTSAWWNVAAGGRMFPGVHHRADFDVQDDRGRIQLDLRSRDGVTKVFVAGSAADALPRSSIFPSLAEASRFFELGSRGYSPAHEAGRFDGLELRTRAWSVAPFDVAELRSSVFDSRERFPEGSVVFDNALLMRDIPHEWHALDSLRSDCDGK
jgi:hypothetical protein